MSPCVCSLRWTAWGSSSFFHWYNPHWFLQPEVVGTYLPSTGTLGWGPWCGIGSHHCWNSPPEFLSTTCGCGTSPFCVWAPPTSVDGCGFFNSVVIRLLFNSVSDGCEWWLFHILVVILISVVQGGEPCLPTLPYWLEVINIFWMSKCFVFFRSYLPTQIHSYCQRICVDANFRPSPFAVKVYRDVRLESLLWEDFSSSASFWAILDWCYVLVIYQCIVNYPKHRAVKQLFYYAYGFCGPGIRWGTAQIAQQCLGPQLVLSKGGVDSTAVVWNYLNAHSVMCLMVTAGCWWDLIQAISYNVYT